MGSLSAMKISPVVRLGSGSRESAAEGADQLHVEGEGPGLEVGDRLAGGELTFFGRKDVEVCCETMLVTLPGEAARLFEVGQRAARFREPRDELLLARHGIGSLAQRLNYLAIVEGYSLVILTAATAVLALERATVEEGEAYRGADASKTGAAREEVAEAEGLQPDQGAQIDVGIESGTRFLDPLCRGLDPRP